MNNTESVELTKLPINITETLDGYTVVRSELKLERLIEPMLGGMIFRLKTYILAEEIDNRSKVVSLTTTHPVYRSWWDYFKGDMFPDWLKKRFPPKFLYVTKTEKKKVTFRRYATYPKASILFPDKVGTLVRYKSSIEEDVVDSR